MTIFRMTGFTCKSPSLPSSDLSIDPEIKETGLDMDSHGTIKRKTSPSFLVDWILGILLVCCLVAGPAVAGEISPGLTTLPFGTGAPGGLLDQGVRAFHRGDFDQAIAAMEADSAQAEQRSDQERCETLILLAQARTFAGQHQKALENLTQALALAEKTGDDRQRATALGAIGNLHLASGRFDQASTQLQQGLALARKIGAAGVAAGILNNLGNYLLSQNNPQAATSAYREAAALAAASKNGALAAAASVNGASAALKSGALTEAIALLDDGTASLRAGEDSYAKAYGLINAGLAYATLGKQIPGQEALATQAFDAFRDALFLALRMKDTRTASYAYGHLGALYEEEGRTTEALELSRQAIFSAQLVNAPESLYKWHRQTGRILARMGRLDDAITSYRLAIHDLQGVREEMSSCYANPESSYQKTAGVIGLELVDLLLQKASRLDQAQAVESCLGEARETLEAVKVFELRDYFKDDCVDAARFVGKKLDQVSPRAVIIYPILLPDRIELLASFAGHLKRYILPVGVAELTGEIREFRRKLVKRTTFEFLPHAQKLYDWLIRPLEADLDRLHPDTLVFVPDGALRTIPMAALHDGKLFLIDRFPIAITPSLNLTDPTPLAAEQGRMLTLGLTAAVQGFPGLPYVSEELKAIRELYRGETLIDSQFRPAAVETMLKKEPFSMVHIASHAQFGGESRDTFLLAFDSKFSMERFGDYVGLFRFRDEPLDLLTLSACETAAGDDRAALGLAGVAVRAGARSAIATLWHVNDPASFELIGEFYRQLKVSGTSRAAALQAAQLKLLDDLRYDHPGYWAPFLLINNWL